MYIEIEIPVSALHSKKRLLNTRERLSHTGEVTRYLYPSHKPPTSLAHRPTLAGTRGHQSPPPGPSAPRLRSRHTRRGRRAAGRARRRALPYLCISLGHLRRPAGTPAPRRRNTRRGRDSQPWPAARPALRGSGRPAASGMAQEKPRQQPAGAGGGRRCQPSRGNAPAGGRSGFGSRPSERGGAAPARRQPPPPRRRPRLQPHGRGTARGAGELHRRLPPPPETRRVAAAGAGTRRLQR